MRYINPRYILTYLLIIIIIAYNGELTEPEKQSRINWRPREEVDTMTFGWEAQWLDPAETSISPPYTAAPAAPS